MTQETVSVEIARLQKEISERQERLWFLVYGDPRKTVSAPPCTQEAITEGCTCHWSSVNSATLDPPHEVIDKHCPLHGYAPDLDEEYEAWRSGEKHWTDDTALTLHSTTHGLCHEVPEMGLKAYCAKPNARIQNAREHFASNQGNQNEKASFYHRPTRSPHWPRHGLAPNQLL